MTANARHSTAQIYQFPVRPRASARSMAAGHLSSTDRQLPQAAIADFGSGWYHDAAIKKEPVSPHAG